MKGFFRDLANLANLVTSLGIILTAWLNMIIWSDEPINHLVVFLLAVSVGISDLLDGWLARRLQVVTSVGGFLDKFRDKFFACSVFVFFLRELWRWNNGIWLALIEGLIMLILVIELFLIIVWIIGFVKGFDVNPHQAGKIKTGFYFVAIGWWFFLNWLGSLWQRDFENWLYLGLIFLLLSASIYGILSVVGYLQRYNSQDS